MIYCKKIDELFPTIEPDTHTNYIDTSEEARATFARHTRVTGDAYKGTGGRTSGRVGSGGTSGVPLQATSSHRGLIG